MSNFEYMGRVTIGQYLPLDSLLHRLDARARIFIFFFPLVLITFEPKPFCLLLAILLVFAGLLLAHIPLSYALRGLLPPLPFLLMLAIFQIFLSRSQTPEILFKYGPLILTCGGILAGITLLLRFTGLILALSLATFCLSTSHLVHGLESLLRPLNRIGIPTRDLIMIIQVTVRFLPLLAQTAERIAKAQAARGAEWGTGQGNLFQRARQVIPLLVPLFITSLHKAENMALAMDARAYGSVSQVTSMVELDFRLKDGLAVAASGLLCLGIMIFNI
ncbi:MAG: energy-coupling factor transporter transmembrane component T [Anaerolineaceae bacterium]